MVSCLFNDCSLLRYVGGESNIVSHHVVFAVRFLTLQRFPLSLSLSHCFSGKPWQGPAQYESKDGALMMLPSDMALLEDKAFRPYVELYAKDEEAFFKDFSAAFAKLTELGVPFPAK